RQRVNIFANPRHMMVTSRIHLTLPEVGISRAEGLPASDVHRDALPKTINRNHVQQNEEEGEKSGENQSSLGKWLVDKSGFRLADLFANRPGNAFGGVAQ